MTTTMRRCKQQLPADEAKQLLTHATHGVLSLVGTDGLPYGVPLSFVYDGRETIFFHCAREGRKMDCLRRTGRGSFCAVTADDVVPEEFTTYYRSVIAEGRIAELTDEAEIVCALRLLAAKYSPGLDSSDEIAKGVPHVSVLRFDIESLSGKESIELTRRRIDYDCR